VTVYGVNIPAQGFSGLPNPPLQAQFIHITGCTEVRTELRWSEVQPDQNTWDWSTFDEDVTLAAQNSLTVLPLVWMTPKWISTNPNASEYYKYPPTSQGPWGTFCKEAAKRYRPGGQFWTDHPSLTPRPITLYEIWNEPNNLGLNWIPRGSEVQSVSDYIALYNTAKTQIHAGGAGLQAMVGGLAPVPGFKNWGWDFQYYLQLLKNYGIDTTYGPPDAVGFHPYGFNVHNDGSATTAHSETINRTKFFLSKLTDLGWGNAGADITEDGIPTSANGVTYPEQWERYNYFWDTARDMEDALPRIRRYHAYSWILPDAPEWSIAYEDMTTTWREAVAGYARGISE
jgi:hypothetical protein